MDQADGREGREPGSRYRPPMNNPIVHALVFVTAVVVPGGLLVYFAWRFKKAKKARDVIKEKDLLAHNVKKTRS